VSPDDTSEESAKAGAGNGTVRGGTDADAVPEINGEKYGTKSNNVTSADTKYFLVEGL